MATDSIFACPTEGGPGPLLHGALWPVELYRFVVAGAKAHQNLPAAKPTAPLPKAVVDKFEPGWVAPLANDVPLILALLSGSSEDQASDHEAIGRLSRRLAEGRTESLPKLELAGSIYVALQISLMNDATRFAQYLGRGTVPSIDASVSSRSLGLEKTLDEFPQAAAFMHKDGKGASERFSEAITQLVENRTAIQEHSEVTDTLREGYRGSARKLVERYQEIFGKAPEKIEGNSLK